MTVYFIGAGPGAPDLLTLRAHRLITTCQTVLYAGSIVPDAVLEDCRSDATLINTARMPLDTIIDHIAQAHAAGHDVARLQSGDPSIYSALAEQARRLVALEIPYEIVPGVPAYAAAAAALGHELTVPTVGQSLVITRISGRASAMPERETLENFAALGATMAIHLAAHDGQRVQQELLTHLPPQTPVAIVAYASRQEEQLVRTRLDHLAAALAESGITRTAVIFVGEVLAADGFPDSYLYSDGRPRDEHGRTIPCVR
ncbi:precorrin-4 C(11)-methyltransferase [Corynebacterium choanae]|uniref:Precorrin-4 C(11)-methyltransferase n=1 Tax=Corynebacterium choanae TaxID=1862358 RepID=A0A3G6JBN3_9CORY|nr:precorrin-4 C(11)-methyltransferase [Corynebacterium choanae]AZA13554.1 Precorrin-4 C(11)-methyltransferase [Corynebacterium choanae]